MFEYTISFLSDTNNLTLPVAVKTETCGHWMPVSGASEKVDLLDISNPPCTVPWGIHACL